LRGGIVLLLLDVGLHVGPRYQAPPYDRVPAVGRGKT